MEVRPFSPDDREALRAWVEVTNAVRRADSPWEHPMTERQAEGLLRHGWDGEPDLGFVATHDGVVVAAGSYGASDYDNLELAWVDVGVHPEHRRQGHGTTLLGALVDHVRAQGRSLLTVAGWDTPAARAFAAAQGLEPKSRDLNRRQLVTDADWSELDRLYDAAVKRAAAYELVRRDQRTPDAELEALAEMTSAINDAPTDDLDIEDEVYSAERIRAYEAAQSARGDRLYRVLARHRESGELAGQTVVAVDGERPHLSDQHDTSVVGAHRGHRLGVLLKVDMLRWLRDAEPQLQQIDTWNAESNDFMIGVNQAMGYHVLGRVLMFQRTV